MTEERKIELIMNEANGYNLESLQNSLDIISKTHADVIDSIYESKIKLGTGEVYIETLVHKMIFTSNSILNLSKGTEISSLKYPDKRLIYDRSSIYILARSIIETFLTLEYLYFNDTSSDEKIFRYNLWRMSGFISRHNLIGTPKSDFEEKINSEKQEIHKLKVDIKKSIFYKKLRNGDVWKLDSYGLPRIISWKKLIDQSVINNDSILKAYGLYSNYAHSEFLSAMQLNEGGLSILNEHNRSSVETTLYITKLINCVTIILLQDKFDCTKDAYIQLDEEIKFSIEFSNKLAIGK